MSRYKYMNPQNINPLHIILSILAGTLFIFLAWHSNKTPEDATTLTADTFITPTVVPTTNSSNPSNQKIFLKDRSSAPEEPFASTTVTSLVAKDLLVAYGVLQEQTKGAPVTDDQAAAVANEVIKGIKLPEGKRYTLSNLKISNDDSNSAITAYEETATKIITDAQKTKPANEYILLIDILKKNTPERSSEFAPIIKNYDLLINGLLAVKVPSSVASLHLRLIQSYSNMQNLTKIMSQLPTDPIAAIATIPAFQKELALQIILQEDYIALSERK